MDTVMGHTIPERQRTGNHTAGVLLMPNAEPLMQVVPGDADRWGAALARGQQRGISIQRGQTVQQLGCEVRGYIVPERRSTGHRTGVVVARDYAGDVWTGCGCADGQQRVPCLHSALAIADAGWWPVGIPADPGPPLDEGRRLIADLLQVGGGR